MPYYYTTIGKCLEKYLETYIKSFIRKTRGRGRKQQ